jgi:Flp pilus assembly protein TadD
MRRHGRLSSAAWLATLPLVLGGCEGGMASREDPLAGNIIDDAELADLLLAAGDPEESVGYFTTALAAEPDRADFRRGLAVSLARARRYPEAARVFGELVERGQAEPSDRLEYGMISARLDRWDDVRTIVAALPPGMNSASRYMLEAMLADHEQNWPAADAAYAQAQALSADPAEVLNNWGVSQMSRGALPAAEDMFESALSFDSRLFSAKNNLAIARGLQGDFQLPAVPMTEAERAILLNNLGVIALRSGRTDIAKGLFAAAVETHPQHYAAAASRLAALESAGN